MAKKKEENAAGKLEESLQEYEKLCNVRIDRQNTKNIDSSALIRESVKILHIIIKIPQCFIRYDTQI